MIPLPKVIPPEPGCLVRYSGINTEGLALYQCVLWFGHRCFVSAIRTPGSIPELSHLQGIYAHHPHLWTPIAGHKAA